MIREIGVTHGDIGSANGLGIHGPLRRRELIAAWLALASGAICAAEGVRVLNADAWRQAIDLAGVDVKSAPDSLVGVIVFFDPNCPVCARLWARMYGDKSKFKDVASRWVPVAYFSQSSLSKSAAILSSGYAALKKNFAGFDHQNRLGGAPDADFQVSASLRPKIQMNMSYWERLGAATPLMIYQTKGDTLVRAQIGLPPDEAFASMMEALPKGRLASFK